MIHAGNYGKFKTKKMFKEQCIGRIASLVLVNPSLFGDDIPKNDTFPIVGPSATERKWYGQVTTVDGVITAVK